MDDLVGNIPGQDNHVIGPQFLDLIRRQNGNVAPRRELALLSGAAVKHRVNPRIGNAAHAQECVALGSSSIGGHLPAGCFSGRKVVEKLRFDIVDTGDEALVATDLVERMTPLARA